MIDDARERANRPLDCNNDFGLVLDQLKGKVVASQFSLIFGLKADNFERLPLRDATLDQHPFGINVLFSTRGDRTLPEDLVSNVEASASTYLTRQGSFFRMSAFTTQC